MKQTEVFIRLKQHSDFKQLNSNEFTHLPTKRTVHCARPLTQLVMGVYWNHIEYVIGTHGSALKLLLMTEGKIDV